MLRYPQLRDWKIHEKPISAEARVCVRVDAIDRRTGSVPMWNPAGAHFHIWCVSCRLVNEAVHSFMMQLPSRDHYSACQSDSCLLLTSLHNIRLLSRPVLWIAIAKARHSFLLPFLGIHAPQFLNMVGFWIFCSLFRRKLT